MTFEIEEPPLQSEVLDDNNLLKNPFQLFLTQLVYLLNNKIVVGEFTATAGSTSDTIPVDDLTATGFAFVQTKIVGASAQRVISAEAQAGQILVTYSAAPGAGHVIYYMAVRGSGGQ
jgi:hypothetical protein